MSIIREMFKEINNVRVHKDRKLFLKIRVFQQFGIKKTPQTKERFKKII